MRRRLEDSRPSKRSKLPAPLGRAGAGGVPFVPVDRFRYAVVGELEAGAKGFVVTCNFRKEKSATREASQLLRRYMPAHLFPPPPQPELVPASQAVPQGPQGMVEAQPAAGAAAGAGKEVGAEAQQEVPGGRKAAAAAAKEDEEVEGDAESGGSSDDDSEEGQDPAGVGAAAAGAGAADHHPEPSALGLAKVIAIIAPWRRPSV
ncbi:hypothetical protein HYH02_004479 [Chlamydomonas schloesseri]|uniref:Uncharacterized protein n=1 Tax=Chlamydomonas schloesseri TaxID=2026947 RepID=A0A836B8T8_9CHLO|nr:hypothetical protein HYH02_004479 [Chlamydomonas schloesseri]|eukprot:KAG2450639.1 hypothetical protein HYH02_004479 [Chlamydomonas schloesseri]